MFQQFAQNIENCVFSTAHNVDRQIVIETTVEWRQDMQSRYIGMCNLFK